MRIWLLATVLALSGCGWHSGLTLPEGTRSVGVAAARREGTVLERGLEPELTDALSRAVLNWVDLPLLDPSEADVVLHCTVLEYRRRGGVRTPQNELIETAVFVRARAELRARNGARVGEPVTAQGWSAFALDEPANEEGARERAVRHVADSLVLDLFGGP